MVGAEFCHPKVTSIVRSTFKSSLKLSHFSVALFECEGSLCSCRSSHRTAVSTCRCEPSLFSGSDPAGYRIGRRSNFQVLKPGLLQHFAQTAAPAGVIPAPPSLKIRRRIAGYEGINERSARTCLQGPRICALYQSCSFPEKYRSSGFSRPKNFARIRHLSRILDASFVPC